MSNWIISSALVVAALTLLVAGFLIWKGKLQLRNPIRAFAVLCVAVISTFVMWMRYWQLEVLSSPDWCNRAMKAEQLDAGSRLDAALACVGLQQVQIKAIANNSYIDGGTVAGCLLTLIVIVIAGAKLDASISKAAINFHLSKEKEAQKIAAAAAEEVADAAEAKKDEIVAEASPKPASPVKPKFTAPPGEEL